MRDGYLSGRTTLHLGAVHGHVRCIRLVVACVVPSASMLAQILTRMVDQMLKENM